MCGSVTVLSPTINADALIREALRILETRGPDQQSMLLTEHGGIGHCRLILRDAEGGAQPLRLEDGRILAFVGELYNDVRLRGLLEAAGWRDASPGDTAVLARALNVWGDATWERADGMFAVSLLSQDGRSLQLVRDRFGIKPLYVAHSDGVIAAASEPAALRGVLSNPSASRTGLAHFLGTAQVSCAGQTIWSDIQIVEPGTSVTVGNGALTSRRWSHQTSSNVSQDSFDIAASKVRYLLNEAVYNQGRADYPVGVFLSGGLDSSLLAALFAEHHRNALQTYAVALEGDEEDLTYATVVAEHLCAKHHSLVVTIPEFFAAMRELTALRGLPVSLPNEVLIYLLSKHARRDVKAALCGEGADELFGGYHRLHARVSAELATSSLPNAYRRATSWFTALDLRETLLNPRWADEARERDLEQLSGLLDQAVSPNALQTLLLHEHYPHLLLRLDGATMAASLEGRVPFADNELVQYVTSLPVEFFRPAFGLEKPLLRKAGQGLLPECVLKRPKRAFNASLRALYESEEGQSELFRALQAPLIAQLFREEKLKQLLNEENGSLSFHRTWLVCSLAMWSNICGVNEIS